MLTHLECASCGRGHEAGRLWNRCACGGTLLGRYDTRGATLTELRDREPGLWRYRELLPVEGDPVTLGEAETPLHACPRLSERWGVEVLLKDDGMLPGGTFKARGAAAGVSRARELGATAIVMPSAGNAGGAWAAYAARARMPITITMAETAPRTNQVEAQLAGAELVLVPGTLSDAGRAAREIAERTGAFLASTFWEPYRLDGKKTAFLEAYDRLGAAGDRMRFPGTVVVPVGGGVAALAAMKAAEESVAAGWAAPDGAPWVVGVQPEACAPITRAFETGEDVVEPWTADPWTIAAGLRVPGPAEGTLVLRRFREAGGLLTTASEHEIVDAVRDVASCEGILLCPEAAAVVPAAARLAAEGRLGGPVVLYSTGSALKYLDALAG